jgi:hypothetical protein
MATEVVLPQPGYAKIRRWPRYRINVPVRLVVQRPDKTVIVSGRGMELNEGGMALFAGVELKLEQRVEVEFTPPYDGQPVRVRGAVRDRNGYHYGIEFLLLNGEDKEQVVQIRHVLQAMGSPADD